jgi:hypothetical protein
MPIVTTLSFVRAVKGKARGVRVTLTCYNCREYGSCAQPQETPIHLSKERTTMRACLQEMLKRLQEKHGKCAEALTNKAAANAQAGAAVHSPNVLQAMMLFQQAKHRAKAAQDHAKAAQDQAKVANKVALQAEKDDTCILILPMIILRITPLIVLVSICPCLVHVGSRVPVALRLGVLLIASVSLVNH